MNNVSNNANDQYDKLTPRVLDNFVNTIRSQDLDVRPLAWPVKSAKPLYMTIGKMRVGGPEVNIIAHVADHSLEIFATETGCVGGLPRRKSDYLVCFFLDLFVIGVLNGDSDGRFCACYS